MRVRKSLFPAVCVGGALLGACRGEGNWELRIRGGEAASFGLGTDDFSDGCAAVFDSFVVHIEQAELIDEDGASGGGIRLPSRIDMVASDVIEVALVPVMEGTYETVALQLGSSDSPAITVSGVITCQSGTVELNLDFDGVRDLSCDADKLVISNKDAGDSELNVAVDVFFVDGGDPTSTVRVGTPYIDADANHDGRLSRAELNALEVEEGVLGELIERRLDGLVRSEGGEMCVRRGV